MIHNELRKRLTLPRALGLIAGLGHDQSGVERLGETLTPILDPWSRPEHQFLHDEEYFVFALLSQIAAGVGRSMIEIIPQPGHMMIVEQVSNHAGLTLNLNIGDNGTVVNPAGGSLTLRDTRFGKAPQVFTKVLSFIGNASAGPHGTYSFQIPSGVDWNQPYVIDGGQKAGSGDGGKLIIEATADAIAIPVGVVVFGRSRARATEERVG